MTKITHAARSTTPRCCLGPPSILASIGLLCAACAGGPVVSGLAVAKVGTELGERAGDVPQGGTICAYQEALAQPSPSGTDKPLSEACKKASQSEVIWRRSLRALGAYSEKLEALSEGEDADNAGKVEGAMLGATDPNWAPADGPAETSARDAVTQLAIELKTNPSKGDLAETIKQAAPHVKTICDGLSAYLDAEVKAVNDASTEIEKRRTTHNDRRCASLDGKNVCVQESVLDRMTYAGSYGDLGFIGTNHSDTRDVVAEFCAAHAKLADAATSGTLSKDKTTDDVLDTIANAKGGGHASAPADAKPDAKPDAKAAPAETKAP
jgi:hypothetical protein